MRKSHKGTEFNSIEDCKVFKEKNQILLNFFRQIVSAVVSKLSPFLLSAIILFSGTSFSSVKQESSQWSPLHTIPGYHPASWPPILIADRNRTVHAFSYQWLRKDDGSSKRAIVYNIWSPETGWTEPVDILLSPLKDDARLTNAFMDQNGMMHIVFFGGDNTQANLFYSKAPAIYAGKTSAWSKPIVVATNIQDPENASFFTDGSKNLGILFAGKETRVGVYTTTSTDGGEEWSNPIMVFSTSRSEMLINNLQIFQGQSEQIHSIWNEITISGQGRGIYYSSLKFGDNKWKEPIKIGEAESGFGTNTPAIFERNDEIFAFYNLNGLILMRRSVDGGESWSDPVKIFSRHVGVNGSLAPVLDIKNDLHLFFGQRVPGNPDIHGMWHSKWQGSFWTEPEPIVSGPSVHDEEGDNAFDPYEARAVVSQGNVLLVTWRSDPGLKGNGVWYSYKILDLPELPVETLPTIHQSPTPETGLEEIDITPTAQSQTTNPYNGSFSDEFNTEVIESEVNPANSILLGIVPTILLITGVIVLIRKFRR